MIDDDEVIAYELISIVFDKFKLDTSYSRGKEIRAAEIKWFLGINWTVDVQSIPGKDELKIFNQLDLYRKKDDFNIARMHMVTTYTIGKGISFSAKYNILIELCNHTSAQLQGAWRIKIHNKSVATCLPQSFNKAREMETDFKKMIYETWQ